VEPAYFLVLLARELTRTSAFHEIHLVASGGSANYGKRLKEGVYLVQASRSGARAKSTRRRPKANRGYVLRSAFSTRSTASPVEGVNYT